MNIPTSPTKAAAVLVTGTTGFVLLVGGTAVHGHSVLAGVGNAYFDVYSAATGPSDCVSTEESELFARAIVEGDAFSLTAVRGLVGEGAVQDSDRLDDGTVWETYRGCPDNIHMPEDIGVLVDTDNFVTHYCYPADGPRLTCESGLNRVVKQ